MPFELQSHLFSSICSWRTDRSYNYWKEVIKKTHLWYFPQYLINLGDFMQNWGKSYLNEQLGNSNHSIQSYYTQHINPVTHKSCLLKKK